MSSNLELVSIGKVATNLKLGSDEIEVWIMEHHPFINGELTDDAKSLSSQSRDSAGETFSTKIITTATVKAKWLGMHSGYNRTTPPDVRRGEELYIYRFANSQEYFWEPKKYNRKLRRLETVRYEYSNLSKEDVEVGPDTSYYHEVSTHKKVVTFHTSNNDGELTTYDINFDTKTGIVKFVDGKGNALRLNSKENSWRLTTADKAVVDLTKRKLTILVDEFALLAEKSIDIETTTLNQQTQTTNEKASTTNLTSKFNITGATDIQGDTSTSGTLKNNGKNVGSTHTHGGVSSGLASTAVPN